MEYLKKIDQKARRMKQLSEHLFEYSLLSGEDEVKLEEPDNFETLLYDLFQKRAVIWNRGDFRRFFKSGGRIKKSDSAFGRKNAE